MSWRVMTMLSTGRMWGRITNRSRWKRLAPSTTAASVSSRGMSWRAARKSTKARPRSHQMEATLTPTSDHSIEVSQGTRGTPKKPRYWLTSPNWVSRSQTQTSPMTVAETTVGAKNRVRARA